MYDNESVKTKEKKIVAKGDIEPRHMHAYDKKRTDRGLLGRVNRDLTQRDGWKTRDGRMTKKCCARLCIPGLARHFYTSFFRPESSSRPVA